MSALYLPSVGGMEVLVSQLTKELLRREHEVSVLTSRDDPSLAPRERVEGVEVIRTDAHDVISRRDLPGILRVQRETWTYLHELGPDVIHAHDASPALWMYLRAARANRPPVLVTLHSVMTEHFASTGASIEGLRTILRAADWVTGVAPRVVGDVCALEPSVADRISVVANGIAPPDRSWSTVDDGPDRLLCIGRLVSTKGFERALAVVDLLVSRRPTVRLTIVGDGPERSALERLARDLAIDDRVAFLGSVPHDRIGSLIADSTVVVMPSRFEGMPLVALEAAWMARPVVASSVPGLDDAIVDGLTGVLVEGDDSELASAIEGLLVDRDRARAMGAAARVHAEKSFSLESCVERYVEIYARLVAESEIRS